MSGSPTPTPVLVVGDVFIDHLLYTGHDRWPNSTLDLGARTADLPGGPALLAEVLTHLMPAGTVTLGADLSTRQAWPRMFAVYDRFAADPAHPKGGKVWRMREPLGYENPPAHVAGFGPPPALGSGGMLVIDDAGLTFRRAASRSAWPQALTDPAAPPPDWIVLKSHAPLAAGDLWHHLMADPRDLPRRTVVVLPCAELRSEQVSVTPGLSWERAALDLAGEFRHNPTLAPLCRCRYVIVRFDTDGALLADFAEPCKPSFHLLFDPAHLEGDWAARMPGRVYGYNTTFAAAIAATLAGTSPDGSDGRARLERGIAAGLAATRRLLLAGHGPGDKPPGLPLDALAKEFREPTFTYSAAPVPVDKADWSIATSVASGGARSAPLYGLARRVALNGVSALRGLPFQRFGHLFIVDRGEIESLRGLRRLVADYARPVPADKPLSIAVFGAPGSGKSFGVKQLARAVLGDQVPILEFNLSQFDGPVELLGLLHQVRDKVLEGRMPVVFWDEFDSKQLMWLQYLLAPMQDGRVQDGQISHPIGKCLFVFAGGTSHEFNGFGPPPAGPADPPDAQAAWKWFRECKGPDFKSRLNGYLNVLGPNPRQLPTGDDPADVSFPIRRALLLRAKMGLFGDERLQIDRGVLSAFLEIRRFTHGARSMEKVIEQTRAVAGTGRVGRSHLPPRQLLELHVDADEFLALVERDLGFQVDVEAMAEAYHEYYREKFGGDEHTGKKYAELDEYLKDDNRAAARRICEVVSLVGLYVVKVGMAPAGSSQADTRAAIEQNLEVLAEAEHDGWVESRQRNGWTWGPNRNMPGRETPKLIPYAQLSADDQRKDREAVRRYMDIVARANYEIVTGPPPLRQPPPPAPAGPRIP